MSAADVEPIMIEGPTTVTTVTDAIIRMVQEYFSYPANNLVSPALQKTTGWHSDPIKSSIWIGGQESEVKDVGRRPAIIVRRGPWKLVRGGIGNVVQNETPAPGYLDKTVVRQLQGAHVLSCVSHTEQQADELAHELLMLFEVQTIAVITAVGLSMHVVEMSEPTKGDPASEYKSAYVTRVTAAYEEMMQIGVSRETPIWKQLRFTQK